MKPHQLDLIEWIEAQPSGEVSCPVPREALLPADLVLLHRIDPAVNMHRFYLLTVERSLFGEWGVLSRWGRIGGQGRGLTEWHPTVESAAAAMRKAESRKRRRGYKDRPASSRPAPAEDDRES